MTRARTICAVVAIAAGAATLAIAVAPPLRFAYFAPSARVALETSATLIALLVAYIVIGRWRRTRRIDHLGLAAALLVLAAANLLLATLVAVGEPWGEWRMIASGGTLAGALLLALAGFLPDRRLGRPGSVALPTLLACAALVGLCYALVKGLAAAGTLDPIGRLDPGRPHVLVHPVASLQVISTLALATAAIGFVRKRERRLDDDLVLFVAMAAVIGAFGRVNYLLYPPFLTEWVHTGDIFRLLFYLVLVIGAAREIQSYWRGLADAAVLEERRRIARDLHDGVAQELAFIDRTARRLAKAGGTPARQISAAAARGLADSRRAIAALTRPLDEPLADVIAQATEDIAARTGIALTFELAPDIRVQPAAREALVRIACEAVANAAVHGQARAVRVELENGAGVALRVVDDGVGFEPEAIERGGHGGFGLVSMRERANAIGGELTLRSRPGAGTAVEVRLR